MGDAGRRLVKGKGGIRVILCLLSASEALRQQWVYGSVSYQTCPLWSQLALGDPSILAGFTTSFHFMKTHGSMGWSSSQLLLFPVETANHVVCVSWQLCQLCNQLSQFYSLFLKGFPLSWLVLDSVTTLDTIKHHKPKEDKAKMMDFI